MEVRDWSELENKLCKTLEDMSAGQRKSFDRAEIDIIDKLTHSIDKIGKIKERKMGEYDQMGSGYGPRGGMWNAEGSYGRMMDDSYGDRSGMHYTRGYYSRGENENPIMDRNSRPNY